MNSIGLLLALAALGVQAPEQDPVFPDVPLGARRSYANSYLRSSASFQTNIFLSFEERAVFLTWTQSTADKSMPERDLAQQKHPVEFLPTAAEPVADERLLVAGVTASGSTHIELWRVKSPVYEPAVPGTNHSLCWKQPPIEVERVVYDAKLAGRSIVRGMIRRRGPGDAVLLHFDDSRDLCEMIWSADRPQPRVLFTPKALPGLGGDFDHYHAGDHRTEGYVYVFANIEDLGLTPWVVLLDADRDGVIDSAGKMAQPEYHSRQFDDRLQYREYCGL